MSKLKDFLFPALAGLDDIQKADINPLDKTELLRSWDSPWMNRKALKELRVIIKDLEGSDE